MFGTLLDFVRVDSARAASVGLLVAALLVTVATAAPATAQSDEPTVRVDGATVGPSETTTVRIVLSNAPSGLSGYNLELSVADPEVASIQDATYPESLGLTTDPRIDNGESVRLEAADLDGTVQPGASNVTLATVTVRSRAAGETRLSVASIHVDDDDGNRLDPASQPATLTVTESQEPTATPTVDDGTATTSTATATDSETTDSEPEGVETSESDETDPATDSVTPSASGALPLWVPIVALGTVIAAAALLGRRT